jgi:CDP-6-deoxy-D-xylo-4-hexulose-3-dehydrase
MGAKYNNRYTGGHGIIGTQSFFFSHHLQTMEGGMVTIDNQEDDDWLRSLRAHGWCRDLSPNNPLFNKTGSWKDNFTFVTPGYTVRPLEMSGAVGSTQLEKWDDVMTARLKNKDYFFSKFGDQEHLRLQKTTGESSWFSFGCICTGALKGRRDELVNAFTEAGIQSRPLASGNWLRQPVMNMLDYIADGDYTGANEIEDEGFFVGNGMQDVSEGIDKMHEVVQQLV